jgi:tRNA threonylcarbamoyladenosine biosynthesis protein TsaB
MSYILNIDTALEKASVCLALKGEPLAFAENENQKGHSAWLHTTIQQILAENNCSVQQLDAIAVSHGPGSYTGIRIGLSAAKGLCYALNKPLIAVSSLELIAAANTETQAAIICPVIDARRMEIYFAAYNKQTELLQEPAALVVSENSFEDLLHTSKVLFCGTGSSKLQTVIKDSAASFSPVSGTAKELAFISFRKYLNNETAPLAAADPLYIKDFFTSDKIG